MRVNAVYQSVEDRDGMLQPGMEAGLSKGYERLDALLARLVAEQAETSSQSGSMAA